MIMRDTVFCAISPDASRDAITSSVHAMVAEVARYVPGYALRPTAIRSPGGGLVGLGAGRAVPRGPRQWRLPAALGGQPGHS